jgi:hypothetical protein
VLRPINEPKGPCTMRQIRADLWETRTDSPFPGLTTHAYLWTAPSAGNAMFYSVAGDADFDQLSDLGGIAHNTFRIGTRRARCSRGSPVTSVPDSMPRSSS